MELREIVYRDGTTSKITVFPACHATNTTFVCLPAMGVRASYYRAFADGLSAKGFNAITADWRGQGHSSVRASYRVDFGYEDIIADIKKLMEDADTRFPATKKILIGHSLGGQLGSLFAARYTDMIHGLVLVTACSVYYKGWNKSTAHKIRFAGNTFYPVSKVLGYFPGSKVGLGGRESRTVMKDWCRNALSGKYEPTNAAHNYEKSLQACSQPVLSISVKDDRLASEQAVKNLYEKFGEKSVVSHLHLTSETTGVTPLTHFSWAKYPEPFVNLITNWTQS